jgi:hypothetical protein
MPIIVDRDRGSRENQEFSHSLQEGSTFSVETRFKILRVRVSSYRYVRHPFHLVPPRLTCTHKILYHHHHRHSQSITHLTTTNDIDRS